MGLLRAGFQHRQFFRSQVVPLPHHHFHQNPKPFPETSCYPVPSTRATRRIPPVRASSSAVPKMVKAIRVHELGGPEVRALESKADSSTYV
jgi:hypothetical protein